MFTIECWEQRARRGHGGPSREKGGPERESYGGTRSCKAVPMACFLQAVAGEVCGSGKDGKLTAIRNAGLWPQSLVCSVGVVPQGSGDEDAVHSTRSFAK